MLEQILNQITEQKKIAEIDLDSVSRRVYPYKKGQVDSAKNKLESLYIDYKNEILNRSIFILVTGDESQEFAKIASEEYECFSVNANDLAQEIVSEINPQIYLNKTAGSAIFDVIDSVLEKKMKKLDVLSYNSLMFDSKYQRNIGSKEDMVSLVQEAINDIVGGEVVALDALEKTTIKAVNKNYKSKIVPILIYSDSIDLTNKLFNDIVGINRRVANITAGKTKGKSKQLNVLTKITEIDSEKVGEALKKIAKKA